MSEGSKGHKGTSVAESEVQQLRMEAQLLQWEKDFIAKRLDAAIKELQLQSGIGEVSRKEGNGNTPRETRRVGYQMDSDIEFQLPEETSGYVSSAARPLSSADTVSEVVPQSRQEVGFRESTPLRKADSGIFSQAEYTPRIVGRVKDDLMLFQSDQSNTEQGKRYINPFLEDRDVESPTKVHGELLSFATRPVETRSNSSTNKVESSSVGPWPLRRDSIRVYGDEGQRGSLEQNRRPNITPDRYSGKLLWKEYHRHFESCRDVNQWNDEQAASYLTASLQGNALRILGDSGQKYTYGVLVKLLERRFGSGRQSENYLVELRHRRQGPKETLQ